MPQIRIISGIEVRFIRRKYGTGTSTRFYTWLHWKDAEGAWQCYGDPWPSSTIPKAELQNAMAEIMAKRMADDVAGIQQAGGDPEFYIHLTPKN